MRYRRLQNQESGCRYGRADRFTSQPWPKDQPWYGYSPGEGQIFSHLDGSLGSTSDHERTVLHHYIDPNLE